MVHECVVKVPDIYSVIMNKNIDYEELADIRSVI